MDENIRNLIISFLNALGIDRDSNPWEVVRNSKNLREKGEFDEIGAINVDDGASKICIVFKNFPFVIKWSPDGGDEAMQEVSIYEDAVNCNIGFFFPKTELFYEHNGVSFVMQEKVDYSASEMYREKHCMTAVKRITKTPTDKIYQKVRGEFLRAGCRYSRDLDEFWAKMAISLYGKKTVKSLCKFVVKHKINDLHSNNIGYKNLRPVILDFCGYHR